jgi:secreted Zn-dependent insulinase-like peptidase
MQDHAMDIYKTQVFEALQDPEKRVTAVLPWKNQIVSGAFSHGCKERVMDAYLTDDEQKKSSFRNHSDHYWKTVKARNARALHEKIYG